MSASFHLQTIIWMSLQDYKAFIHFFLDMWHVRDMWHVTCSRHVPSFSGICQMTLSFHVCAKIEIVSEQIMLQGLFVFMIRSWCKEERYDTLIVIDYHWKKRFYCRSCCILGNLLLAFEKQNLITFFLSRQSIPDEYFFFQILSNFLWCKQNCECCLDFVYSHISLSIFVLIFQAIVMVMNWIPVCLLLWLPVRTQCHHIVCALSLSFSFLWENSFLFSKHPTVWRHK